MLAYLAGRPVLRGRPATLLAVADPAYPRPEDDAPTPDLPASGLAVAGVVPNGNADLNGLREGDVLLSYAGTELKQAGDLKPVDLRRRRRRRCPCAYSREGINREVELAAGRLGVAIDPRPASAFVRARRESRRPAGDAGRVACPAPRYKARSRGPRGALPRRRCHHHHGLRKPARRPCRAWPARESSRATATSTSPPTARPTPASPIARR